MRAFTFAPLFALLVTVAACSSATPDTATGGDTKSGDTRSGDTKSGSGKSSDSRSSDDDDTRSSDTSPTQPTEPQSSGKGLGGICTKDGECSSDLCLFKGSSPRGVCTKQCNNVTDCPGGYTKWDDCSEVGNVTGKVCIPKT